MSQDACRPPIAGFCRSRVTHRADHVAPELRAKPDRAGATLGRTPAYGCRFRKLHPSEWRRQPNQNMIAVDDRNWPAFRPVAAASGSGGGWKPKYGYCGTSSMSCRQRAPCRVHLRWADRALFIWLYRRGPLILDAITIVRPETVVRWHRAGFAAYWRWKSRSLGADRRSIRPAEDPTHAGVKFEEILGHWIRYFNKTRLTASCCT
jgi:hypothetical protein